MALSFGSMFASLTLESASFMSGLDEARTSLRNTQKVFDNIGGAMQRISAVMTVGITAPFVAAGAAAMEGALAQQQAMAQVAASLQSMGPVAGRTAAQLSAAADAFEGKSLVDADVILKDVTANLLTYGNVAGSTFDGAQQAILDMSQKTGKGLVEATTMVGKALQDPAKGLSALAEVGIQFTDGQKNAVKALQATGDIAGAQSIILKELQRQYRGSAEAAANADPYRQLNVAMGQVSDVLGGMALKVVPPLTKAIKGVSDMFLALPEPVQTGIFSIVGVSAAVGPVVGALGTVVRGIGEALPLFVKLRTAIMTQAIPAIISFGATIAPFALPLAAATAAIAGVVLAMRNWDKIQPYVDKVVGWMGGLYTGVKTWVVDKLNAVWSSVQAGIDKVKGWFFGLYDAVVGHSYIPDMVDQIGQHMARLDQTLVAPARSATQSAAEAFEALQQRVAPILERLFPDQAKMNQFRKDMADLLAFAKKEGWSPAQTAEATDRLRREAGMSGPSLPGDITPAGMDMPQLGDIVDETSKGVERAWGRVRKSNAATIESFAGLARDVTGSLGQFAQSIKSGDWLGAIQGVLDSIGQIAGILNGTGTAAPRVFETNSWGGARAGGGAVLAAHDYLVGERGPEILRMGGRGGSIVPNDHLGGGVAITLNVQANDYFDARVDQRSVRAAGVTVLQNNRIVALRARQQLG